MTTKIDTHSPITTAARRLAREVNTTSPNLDLRIGTNGEIIDIHEAGLSYMPHQAPEGIRATVRGGHMSWRGAQDLLDAIAAADAGYGESLQPIDEYLNELDRTREYEAEAARW